MIANHSSNKHGTENDGEYNQTRKNIDKIKEKKYNEGMQKTRVTNFPYRALFFFFCIGWSFVHKLERDL